MVVPVLDGFVLKKIVIRDDEAISQKARQEYVAELDAQARTSDPQALYNLSIEWHSTEHYERNPVPV